MDTFFTMKLEDGVTRNGGDAEKSRGRRKGQNKGVRKISNFTWVVINNFIIY